MTYNFWKNEEYKINDCYEHYDKNPIHNIFVDTII